MASSCSPVLIRRATASTSYAYERLSGGMGTFIKLLWRMRDCLSILKRIFDVVRAIAIVFAYPGRGEE
jgi:hypothetical protein